MPYAVEIFSADGRTSWNFDFDVFYVSTNGTCAHGHVCEPHRTELSAALKADPQLASSLFGRGVAKNLKCNNAVAGRQTSLPQNKLTLKLQKRFEPCGVSTF